MRYMSWSVLWKQIVLKCMHGGRMPHLAARHGGEAVAVHRQVSRHQRKQVARLQERVLPYCKVPADQGIVSLFVLQPGVRLAHKCPRYWLVWIA